jgi:hypothetical protein
MLISYSIIQHQNIIVLKHNIEVHNKNYWLATVLSTETHDSSIIATQSWDYETGNDNY